MKNLIIVKPSGLANNLLGLILTKIEEGNQKIVSIKTKQMDMHSLKKKSVDKNFKESDEKKLIRKALRVPSVLVIIQGKDSISFGQELKKEFSEFVHVSLNEETAKYEINRFFEKKEVIEYKEDGKNYFLRNKKKEEYNNKSIRELTKEFVVKKINRIN